MTAHGHFYWNELNSNDAEKAKAFYAEALGWTYNDMPMEGGVYSVIMDGEEMVGGIFPMTDPMFDGLPEHWLGYIAVDDIDARAAKAVAAGATLIREPWDVPEIGRMAIVKDPNGAVAGWITPSEGVS